MLVQTYKYCDADIFGKVRKDGGVTKVQILTQLCDFNSTNTDTFFAKVRKDGGVLGEEAFRKMQRDRVC